MEVEKAKFVIRAVFALDDDMAEVKYSHVSAKYAQASEF